jgi:diaminopimelate epimerase
MKFYKMHGLGNDFVVVPQNTQQLPENVATLAQQLCDRHFGVGADGLVFLLPSDHADLQMRIFNADGSEAQQCGNAVRCVSKYYYERIDHSKTNILVETKRGIQSIRLEVKESIVERVQVDMGEPILIPAQIPVTTKDIHYELELEGKTYPITAVSMGNPHAVVIVDELTDQLVTEIGPKIEHHPTLPERANVEFITIESPTELNFRVWERGVGETFACGSGACAAVVATVLNEKTSRDVTVHLLGGDLRIVWDEQDNHVYMTGAAEFVFTGEWF